MASNEPDNFLNILVKDVAVSMSRKAASDTQVTRRDLIRTAFAAIEGLVWIFREEVIDAAESTYGLEDDEKAIFEERQLSITEQGKISAQSRFISLASTIRLVARIASRINEADDVDFSGRDWDRFRKAIAVRNRITHPKSVGDLHVTEDDVDQVTNALFWFLERHTDVLARTVTTRKSHLGQFKDVLHKLESDDPEITALYDALRQSDA